MLEKKKIVRNLKSKISRCIIEGSAMIAKGQRQKVIKQIYKVIDNELSEVSADSSQH